MGTQTVAPTSMSLDQKHYDLLLKLRSKFEADEKKRVSLTTIVKKALRELANANGI